MAKQRKFKPQIKKVAILNDSAFSEVTEEIPGSKGIVARTYGDRFHWHKVEVPSDNSLNAGRRDKFHAREALINSMKATGGFLYAVGWAEKIQGHAAPKNPKGGIVKCAQCGALHRRVVFYRSVEGNKYLGHSGINCFLEILRNCGLENAEAVHEHADKESKRIDKFRRIMGKINDFKIDFPGLYENREWLASADNPYSQLWWEVLHQIVSTHRDGITAVWIQGTLDGSLDREYNDRGSWGRKIPKTDQKGRRVFPWLEHVREEANKHDGVLTQNQIREACYDLAYTEAEGSGFRRVKPEEPEAVGATGIASRKQRVPVAQPKPQAPAPVFAPVNTDLQDKGKQLADRGYGWSRIAKRAASGDVLTAREEAWVRKVHKVASAVSNN